MKVSSQDEWIGVDEIIGLNYLNKCMADFSAAGNGWPRRDDSRNAALYRHSYLGHIPEPQLSYQANRLHLLMLGRKALTDVLTHWRNASRLAEDTCRNASISIP